MAPQKRISLKYFVKNYSEANRTELEILEAAYVKLEVNSEAYRLAESAIKAKREFFDYLETAGFEL